VAQQRDEPAREFAERVSHRARRLCKEASIESVDVYAGLPDITLNHSARWSVIADLGDQMAAGGSLTLWSATDVEDPELRHVLAQFAPILAKRQIAMNHQAWEPEHQSGVRYAVPTRERNGMDEFDFSTANADPHQ